MNTLTPRQLEWLRANNPGFAYAEACKLGADANADDCARMANGALPQYGEPVVPHAETRQKTHQFRRAIDAAYRPFQIIGRGHA